MAQAKQVFGYRQYMPYCNTYHILLKLEQHVKWNVTKCPKAKCEHEYLMTVKAVFHSVIIPTDINGVDKTNSFTYGKHIGYY